MDYLYNAIGGVVGAFGVVVIYAIVKQFGKQLKPDTTPSEKHEKKIKATQDGSAEATANAKEKEKEADETHENATDQEVVDRAWDAFSGEPRRSRAGTESTGGGSPDNLH